MCSILGILDLPGDPSRYRERALRLSVLQRHRGPDWSGVFACERAVLGHERLSIVDVEAGAQPLRHPKRGTVLAVNGEIYNHKELEASLTEEYPFVTASDCEVLLPLFDEHGTDFLDDIVGIFAFVLYDEDEDRWIIARDHIGVVPLYTGRDEDGVLHVASEMKALMPVCAQVEEFPPGHFWDSRMGGPVPYYHRKWMDEVPAAGSGDPAQLRPSLEAAVHRQLMSDVPYGALLSGGLDSSIIAAVAAHYSHGRVEDGDQSEAWWPRLHTFAIGLEGSPDLARAAEVAEHIGSVHHGFHFTIEQGLDALPDAIHHLETYDVTTIRAGTPMYLLSRRVRSTGVKMVLSGEGADEIFGGYLYFHRAPNPEAFHEETVRKLDRLHLYDCLRANKAMAAWGVEARVPFLDPAFLDVAMSLDPALKMPGEGRIEKQVLRDAFRDMLPPWIADRQKEQFSDGVGYGWIDALKDHAEAKVSDDEMAAAEERFPINPPTTKEGYFYRTIFEERFPLDAAARTVPGGPSVACSTPEATQWDATMGDIKDPSGRAVRGVHSESY